MKSSLIVFLEDLGLTDNEARVYLACLSIGPSTIIKIAQAAEIKRTTVYFVAESLQRKGLINIQLRGFKKLYQAEDPDKLEAILDSRRNRLTNILPEFKALYNLNGGESFIRYYSGLAAVKNVYESMLADIKPHQDYLVISHTDQWFSLDEKYFHDFMERRGKLNIRIRLLLQDSARTRNIKKKQTEQ